MGFCVFAVYMDSLRRRHVQINLKKEIYKTLKGFQTVLNAMDKTEQDHVVAKVGGQAEKCRCFPLSGPLKAVWGTELSVHTQMKRDYVVPGN